MDFIPNEWLVFLVRWFHVIAAIMWIGNSFYFMWLDANMKPAKESDASVDGELWMVHSGGFYRVQKKFVGPGTMPEVLHWFKWEATLTVLSGLVLLSLVYYSANAAFLIDPMVRDLSPMVAVILSAGSLVLAWFVYDLLWQSKLGETAYAGHLVSLLLLIGLMLFYTQIFSGRAAFIQTGSVIGTLMVLNVWVRILPGQTLMIAATERGEKPDFSHGKRAKKRSVHNSYMTLPLLFMMLSNHMPTAFSHPDRWLILVLLTFLGMACRHAMIQHDRAALRLKQIVPAVVSLALLLTLSSHPIHLFAGKVGGGNLGTEPEVSRNAESEMSRNAGSEVSAAEGSVVSDTEMMAILNRRCVSCHAKNPADKSFGPNPGGLDFSTIAVVRQHAARIKLMAVDTAAMPVANKTKMTLDERVTLGQWIEAQGDNP